MIAPRSETPHANGEPMPRRMRETLDGLLNGQSEKQIAQALEISPNTVHVYVKQVYRRFEVNSRSELLALWIKHNGNAVQNWHEPKDADLATLVNQRNGIVRELQQLDQRIAAVRDKLSQLADLRNGLSD